MSETNQNLNIKNPEGQESSALEASDPEKKTGSSKKSPAGSKKNPAKKKTEAADSVQESQEAAKSAKKAAVKKGHPKSAKGKAAARAQKAKEDNDPKPKASGKKNKALKQDVRSLPKMQEQESLETSNTSLKQQNPDQPEAAQSQRDVLHQDQEPFDDRKGSIGVFKDVWKAEAEPEVQVPENSAKPAAQKQETESVLEEVQETLAEADTKASKPSDLIQESFMVLENPGLEELEEIQKQAKENTSDIQKVQNHQENHDLQEDSLEQETAEPEELSEESAKKAADSNEESVLESIDSEAFAYNAKEDKALNESQQDQNETDQDRTKVSNDSPEETKQTSARIVQRVLEVLEEDEPVTTSSIISAMAYGQEELDDFAKALLDKKTEMAIYADAALEEEKKEPEELPNIMDAKTAEGTMADALDELRKERGQVPIDQEEEDFTWSQTAAFEDRFGDEDDDFTTESLFRRDAPAAGTTVVSRYDADEQRNYIEETEKRPVAPVKMKSRSVRNKNRHMEMEEKPEDALVQDSLVIPSSLPEQSYEEPEIQPAYPANSVMQSVYVDEQNDKEQRSKTLKWAVIVLVLALLCLGGGYLYKTKVFDPAHQATPEQQQIYDRLKTYADDFDALTDAQKKDMAAMLSSYSSMTDDQKDDINAYFKEKTGKTFVEQTASITDSKPASSSSSSKEDQSEDQQQNQTSTPASSDSNSSEQGSSETATTPAAQQTPTADNNQTQTPQTPAPAPETNTVVDNSAAIAQVEQEIAQLQTDRANYIDFLNSEGLPASDEITASYDAQIAYYQNLLSTLR